MLKNILAYNKKTFTVNSSKVHSQKIFTLKINHFSFEFQGSKPLDFEGFVRMVGTKAISVDKEEALTEALSKWDYNRTGLIPISRYKLTKTFLNIAET